MPGDKSIAHRAVLLGAVAEGLTRIQRFEPGADTRSTMEFVRALGVMVNEQQAEVQIAGAGWDELRSPGAVLDCGNSGTTMRLGAGLLAGRPFTAKLTGDASLRRRPMGRVIEPLRAMGAQIESEPGDGRPPLVVRGGRLHGISYQLPVASAQVKSTVLIAGLQAHGETTVIESEATRDHTERLLPSFGVPVHVAVRGGDGTTMERRISVSGPCRLRATVLTLPGDFSSAAFLVVAGLLVEGSSLLVCDIGLNPTRTALLEVLRAMGAALTVKRSADVAGSEPMGTVEVRASALKGVTVDPVLIPRLIDEVPLLCVAGACAEGVTRITGAAELRLKESDRIASIASELRTLGVPVRELPDGLVIEGRGPARAGHALPLRGGTVRSHGDHRIAMALAVAGLVADGGVCIEDADVADVSFPGFYTRLQALAGGD